MKLSSREAALALMQELNIDDEEATDKPDAIDAVEWTTLRTLSPGMDFVDGTLYITVPVYNKTTRKIKGTDETEPIIETLGGCVTSQHEFFMFDRTNLYDRGFQFPKTFAPNENGWGGEEAKAFARGEANSPEPFELYQRLRSVYEEYVEFAEEMYYDIMSFYVMATHVFKVFDTFGYLHFNGTAQSGKSQNLRILSELGFNPSWTALMSAADLYRNIAGNPGILCIDETENFQGERGEALKEILRTGYYTGVSVSRQRQLADGMWVSDKFPTFSPKALASINPLDPVTAQRTLQVGMRPAIRNIPQFKQGTGEYAALRNDLYIFGLENAQDIATLYHEWSTQHRFTRCPDIRNRAWEITSPLIVLADYVGGDAVYPALIEWLTEYYKEQERQSDSTDLIRLLALSLPSYIHTAMAHEGWFYPIKSILENLKSYMDDDSTEKVSTRSIARWLKPLGFREIRSEKGGKQIQILESDLRKVFKERRLTPNPEDSAWLDGVIDYQTAASIVHTTTQAALAWGTEDDDS